MSAPAERVTTRLRGPLGKGGMSGADYREHFVPAGAVYLTTVGYGTGALLGRGVRRVRHVHWLDELGIAQAMWVAAGADEAVRDPGLDELGIAQAMWVFEVERFGPFLVDGDLAGNSLFEEQGRLVNENLELDQNATELADVCCVMAGHEACHFSAHRPREPRATSRRPHRPPSHRRARSRRDWGWRRTPGRPRAGPRADRGGLPGHRARPPATRGPR